MGGSRLGSRPHWGHFQVVRAALPASLMRPPLGPAAGPERLLSSRSAPSPCASSSSYLQTEKRRNKVSGIRHHSGTGLRCDKCRVTGEAAWPRGHGHVSATLLHCYCGPSPAPQVPFHPGYQMAPGHDPKRNMSEPLEQGRRERSLDLLHTASAGQAWAAPQPPGMGAPGPARGRCLTHTYYANARQRPSAAPNPSSATT